MIDFEQTYLHRRAVYRAVQEGQRAESRVAERIGGIAVDGKQELLLLLSAWLLGQDGATPPSDAERADVGTLTRTPLDRWQQLQGVAAQIERDLTAAEAQEKAAQAAFQRQAPFGAGSKLFAAGGRKAQLQALQDEAALKQKHREGLAIARRQNVAGRQALAETFLRDCLSDLDRLSASQTFGKEATDIIGRMTAGIAEAWAGHQKEQADELAQMAGLVDALRTSYTGAPPALPQQPLASSLQQGPGGDGARKEPLS